MRNSSKIRLIDDLTAELAVLRSSGNVKTVVQCHGVFDLMHIGHIRHFEEAKGLGDILVVTVTPDRYVNKGLDRPAFSEELRAETIAALDCVDYVAISKWPTAVESLKLLKPDLYAKGPDYKNPDGDITGKIDEEVKAVESVGGRAVFTSDIVFSSSSLINRYLRVQSKEVGDYLSGFSGRYRIGDVNRYLQSAWDLKVLVVGEVIIDEYQHCVTIGKSAKEPILAAQYMSTDKYAGGIIAVANHVANFCDSVSVIAMLGDQQTQEQFVVQNTNENIDKTFLYKRNSPTIVKRRFLESYLSQKLFEVYEINDEELDSQQSEQLCGILADAVPKFDLVIVADYGHGMLTSDPVAVLCDKANVLAVNTQANAGNRGFNTISKYPRADYVCIASHEIALEERSRRGDMKEMVLSVSRKLDCNKVIVTLGNRGSLCYGGDEGFFEVPAFANKVVDRVGAGDAVLSLTSLCVVQQAPMEVVGFIGNVAGAKAVAEMGHANSIGRVSLMKHVASLMK